MITANDVVANLLRQLSLNMTQKELEYIMEMIDHVRDMEREIELARERK